MSLIVADVALFIIIFSCYSNVVVHSIWYSSYSALVGLFAS